MAKKKTKRKGQSKEALRKLRQKYGLGEYRKKATKSVKKTILKKKSYNYSMARRKANKSYRRSKKSIVGNELVGMFGYAVAEGFIDNIAAKFNIGLPANAVETGLGYFLKKKGGVLGSVGKVMFYVNGTQLIKDVIGGGLNLNNLFSTNSTNNTSSSTEF